jgi:hypothetical protein
MARGCSLRARGANGNLLCIGLIHLFVRLQHSHLHQRNSAELFQRYEGKVSHTTDNVTLSNESTERLGCTSQCRSRNSFSGFHTNAVVCRAQAQRALEALEECRRLSHSIGNNCRCREHLFKKDNVSLPHNKQAHPVTTHSMQRKETHWHWL